MEIIIPSAKVVSEDLQNIGKLPSIIYPVTDRIVFDYLYEEYISSCDVIRVLCYEQSEKIHSKLKKYRKTEILDIPSLSDLAHTVYYGIRENCSIIINFGDTIVLDNIANYPADCFIYSEDYISDKWTYFDIDEGVLTEIYDKKSDIVNSLKKEKLFVGVFYLSDSLNFKKCLEEAFNRQDKNISSFYLALQIYSQRHPLKAVKTDNWFDIGHADKYFNSKLEVKAREFNHIDIDKNRGILTKTSDDKDKFIGEIKWYLKLPADVEYVRPRIFSYSTDYTNSYVSMEYYAYHTVHELFLNGDLDLYQWEKIFKRIKFIISDLNRYKVSDNNIIPSLEDMYLTKTVQRFAKLRTDERFLTFFTEKILINGTVYQPLDRIIDRLELLIPKMLYDVEEFTIIHGDLCFANMMIDNNLSFIKVIDPRGKFGTFDIYGDPRYELAKLFHSVDGKYDYIIKDQFDLQVNGNSIDYSIQDKDRDFDLYNLFTQIFAEEIGNNLKKIELIEALLFLSMIPLHGESFNHQLVMLGTGLDILNRVEDITCTEK